MATFHGQFCWYELMTTNTGAATQFYRAVIGWGAMPAPAPNQDYTILCAGDLGAAGLMALPEAARADGARPGWIGYVAVGDVDRYAARVEEAGGKVHRAATDIPNVGRFAVVADPQGAAFCLFKPRDAGQPPPATAAMTPGRVGWHELRAADQDAAFAFYAGLFGWTKMDALDMGPMGTYQIFATRDVMTGGMMNKTDAMPRPAWLYYFNVDSIDPAVTRTKDAGGQLLHGPHEVPGGSWIAHFLDPQGAMFAMVGPKA